EPVPAEYAECDVVALPHQTDRSDHALYHPAVNQFSPRAGHSGVGSRRAAIRGWAMSNIVLLFLCLAAGVAFRASGRVPDNAHQAINGFIINIALPALTLQQIHGIQLRPDLIYPVLMPWLMFAGVGASVWWIGRRLQMSPATIGALILTTGLANTS